MLPSCSQQRAASSGQLSSEQRAANAAAGQQLLGLAGPGPSPARFSSVSSVCALRAPRSGERRLFIAFSSLSLCSDFRILAFSLAVGFNHDLHRRLHLRGRLGGSCRQTCRAKNATEIVTSNGSWNSDSNRPIIAVFLINEAKIKLNFPEFLMS